ncbi:MAG: D-2-hydroxyacid dehydrogenase [bacterium]
MARDSQLQITFLDAGTVDLGDVDLSALKKAGTVNFHVHSTPEEVLEKSRGAHVVITNKCVLDEGILKSLPDLRLICVAATGVNNVDLKAAERLGVAVTNVAGYSTPSVVEHAFLLMLAFSHRLFEHHQSVVSKVWSNSPHFALFDFPFSDLEGKTLGIVGFGAIGKKVATLAKAFGMNVLVAKIPGRKYPQGGKGRQPLDKVLKESDFVSLHCALTPETHSMMNTKRLNIMKKTAYLLNLSRGPVVNEWAVAEVLQAGRLAGYGADVMEHEPPPPNHPFFQEALKNKVLLTPHIAWASRESRQRLLNEIAANIEAFKKGRKKNRLV